MYDVQSKSNIHPNINLDSDDIILYDIPEESIYFLILQGLILLDNKIYVISDIGCVENYNKTILGYKTSDDKYIYVKSKHILKLFNITVSNPDEFERNHIFENFYNFFSKIKVKFSKYNKIISEIIDVCINKSNISDYFIMENTNTFNISNINYDELEMNINTIDNISNHDIIDTLSELIFNESIDELENQKIIDFIKDFLYTLLDKYSDKFPILDINDLQ